MFLGYCIQTKEKDQLNFFREIETNNIACPYILSNNNPPMIH
jgi:hypothetical protein